MPQPKPAQYVILPAKGMGTARSQPQGAFFSALESAASGSGNRTSTITAPSGKKVSLKVVDSIRESGAKLVEVSPADVAALRAAQPGIRVEPVVYFYPAIVRPRITQRAAAQVSVKITLNIVTSTGKPVVGAMVVAFTDFEAGRGAQGTTNSQGKVSLALGAAQKKIERLYIFPTVDLWPGLHRNVTISTGKTFKLAVIDPKYKDCVRHFYPGSKLEMGDGIRVGVVDTGIDLEHPALTVEGGANTVPGEDADDFGDNGTGGHGSHCAGIIASRSAPFGIAPGVLLRSYRVFGKNEDGASNFAIAKAIETAITDQCDILNMSLGGGSPDTLTTEAIARAREAGLLIFAANGNDGREPVSFPAASHHCQAVSAMGRTGTFPANTEPTGSVARPKGTDKKNFIADFSNIGDDTDFTGPGVGVISTVPGGLGVMSGTSMACPAEAGAAARVIAKHPEIVSMDRTAERWDKMVEAISAAAKLMGFGAIYEGKGMIRS